MFDTMPARPQKRLRTKYIVFAVIGVMIAYVLFHNERFLVEPANPHWQHYHSGGHAQQSFEAFVLTTLERSIRVPILAGA